MMAESTSTSEGREETPATVEDGSKIYNSSKNLEVSGRDALVHGLIDFLKPCVDEVDERVNSVRQSQIELRKTIDAVAEDLRRISEQQRAPVDLEPYVKKLNNSRRRVMLVNNILQNAQDRLVRLHKHVLVETANRKTSLSTQLPPAQTQPEVSDELHAAETEKGEGAEGTPTAGRLADHVPE